MKARSTPFRVHAEKEALLVMRGERPDAFAELPPALHIAVGLYESDRDNTTT